MISPVPTLAELRRRVAVARGYEPADLCLKNVALLDLVTGATVETDVAIVGDTIVGTFGRWGGREEIDGRGLRAVPGFIDAHLHVESSLVTPLEFDRCVLPRGTTTAICDPHEMANVVGAEAFRWFLQAADACALDLRVNLSSCVPATSLETAGAWLGLDDLLPFADHPKVIGLAEMMNFPGVLAGDAEVLGKVAAFAHRHVDGHAPLLRGNDLSAYIAAGIRTDHEATSLEEGLEKLRKGMHVLVREGSVSKDLAALWPLLDRAPGFVALCTDDRNPLDIEEDGHIDGLVRAAIRHGASPLNAYRAASLGAANAFGLRDRGLVAPGRRADIVLLSSVEAVAVERVVSAGRVVGDALFEGRPAMPVMGLGTMRAPRLTADDFRIPHRDGARSVIGVVPGRIITEHRRAELRAVAGDSVADVEHDLLKVAVIERHGRGGGRGLGFVQGFGLRDGAIASSVGHDSHNLCVVGACDEAMAIAANRLGETGGGFCVATRDGVRAELPLPIAGLMSEEPFERVSHGLRELRAAAAALGSRLPEPFLQVAFLSLPVIPHLKITDKGLVDVDRFAVIEG